jgi:hypothetical protein
MKVDQLLGNYDEVKYYFSKIIIKPQLYILQFDVYNSSMYSKGIARIDLVHNGDINSPYPTESYSYGSDISVSDYKTKTICRVKVPRSDKKVYVNGMGKFDNHVVIDLTKFDAYIPKNLEAKTESVKPTVTIIYPENIEQVIRTEERYFSISGKATDNEGIGYVTINGEKVKLDEENKFRERITLELGLNTIQLKAVDFFENSSFISFNIYRTEFVESDNNYSDVDFALETSNSKPNAIAVVFGIEEYQYAPDVTNAYNDAEIMREYLISTFGLKRKNIYFRYNERATKGEFEKVFSGNGWIAKNTDPNSEIYVFYAGHGVASTEDKSAYLIPNDIDPNYASTGYSLDELYQNLSKIKSKSTTIVLDACFSGISRENEMLLADSRPVSIKVKQGSIPKNLNVFSASSGSEISSGYSQKLHGLFTYFFLKGLNKNADINNDKKITYGEMEEYLKENVSSQARKMGREQNPQLHTNDKDKVLLKY